MQPRDESPAGHDACGVGFIAGLRGGGRHVVALGLSALRRLAHRGAPAALGAVDGCGVLTAIPWPFVEHAYGGRLPSGRTRALGIIFVRPADRSRAVEIVERELAAAGARAVVWRRVPTDRAAVLPAQRE